MQKVTYTVSEGIVILNTFNIVLRFAGVEFPFHRWAVSADVFEQLKAQNPAVDFAQG